MNDIIKTAIVGIGCVVMGYGASSLKNKRDKAKIRYNAFVDGALWEYNKKYRNERLIEG